MIEIVFGTALTVTGTGNKGRSDTSETTWGNGDNEMRSTLIAQRSSKLVVQSMAGLAAVPFAKFNQR
jgi:hypothetical protein